MVWLPMYGGWLWGWGSGGGSRSGQRRRGWGEQGEKVEGLGDTASRFISRVLPRNEGAQDWQHLPKANTAERAHTCTSPTSPAFFFHLLFPFFFHSFFLLKNKGGGLSPSLFLSPLLSLSFFLSERSTFHQWHSIQYQSIFWGGGWVVKSITWLSRANSATEDVFLAEVNPGREWGFAWVLLHALTWGWVLLEKCLRLWVLVSFCLRCAFANVLPIRAKRGG